VSAAFAMTWQPGDCIGVLRFARLGLEALAKGNCEEAEVCTWVATDHYIAALEARIRPSDMKELGRASQLRGRRRKK
jgi:hypothetical protein